MQGALENGSFYRTLRYRHVPFSTGPCWISFLEDETRTTIYQTLCSRSCALDMRFLTSSALEVGLCPLFLFSKEEIEFVAFIFRVFMDPQLTQPQGA